VPGKDNGGEGLSVFDSIVLVASVRACGLVGEAIGKVEERLSPRSGELGRVCWRQDDAAGQLWDFEAGVCQWFLSPYWLLYFIFGLSVAMASSQLWVERSTLVVNRALLY
jgi:hypothetical protein